MVHFIGAGPGAEDLITVRGQKLLREADQVIYAGSLVNPALLKETRQGCRILNSAVMTLEEVVAAILEAEGRGETTVRLHTGDPSLYGAAREQMDALDRLHIPYDVCPGVSSMFAAAAALGVEYTLPETAQTVIITRAKGRTPVPERESLRALAAHQATMVLFLSAAMAEKVTRELLAGGYPPETPAAVVYKASWPEERTLRTSLMDLPRAMERADIHQTALILVGEAVRERGADLSADGRAGEEAGHPRGEGRPAAVPRSRLYDPSFSTQYRTAVSVNGEERKRNMDGAPDAAAPVETDETVASCLSGGGGRPKRIVTVVCSVTGQALETRFRGMWSERYPDTEWIPLRRYYGAQEQACSDNTAVPREAARPQEQAVSQDMPRETLQVPSPSRAEGQAGLKEQVGEWFYQTDALIFFCATGIAVRCIAPWIRHKALDPAVVAVDETGCYAVSLLSGHAGGANALTHEIAGLLGAVPVVTTATDREGRFAVDVFAVRNHLCLKDWKRAKDISAAILRGERVGLCTDYPVEALPPELILQGEAGASPTAVPAAAPSFKTREREEEKELPAEADPAAASSQTTNGTREMTNGRARGAINGLTREPGMGILVTVRRDALSSLPYPNTLLLIPKSIHVGIGCKKGVSKERVRNAILTCLKEQRLFPDALAGVASIDLKREEEGILSCCEEMGLPFHTYSAEVLSQVCGSQSASAFVRSVTGVDNVCERSAIADGGTRLLCPKQIYDGVTVALGEEPVCLRMEP